MDGLQRVGAVVVELEQGVQRSRRALGRAGAAREGQHERGMESKVAHENCGAVDRGDGERERWVVPFATRADDELEQVLEREISATSKVCGGIKALETELLPLLGLPLEMERVRAAREGTVPQGLERETMTRIAFVEDRLCLCPNGLESGTWVEGWNRLGHEQRRSHLLLGLIVHVAIAEAERRPTDERGGHRVLRPHVCSRFSKSERAHSRATTHERAHPLLAVARWSARRCCDELDRAEPDMSLAIVGRAMEEGSYFM